MPGALTPLCCGMREQRKGSAGMSDEKTPGRMTAEESAAWLDGKSDADGAHVYSEAYRTPFETDGTAVGMPARYINGTESERQAYRDGYAVRAQDLADGSAATGEDDDGTPWHMREPAPGATYPPMGARQG